MSDITKPDTNPIIPAALNLMLLGGAGYFMIGQQKKGIIATVATIVLLCVGGIGGIIPIITAYDAYLLGEKLKKGESIGENENGLEFLNAVFK